MNKEPILGEIENPDIRDLLSKLLEKDPNKRIEVSEIIKDTIFTKNNVRDSDNVCIC